MNVQIKIRSGASWVALHPKTNLDQLSDITAAGKAIAKLGNPETSGSFIAVTTTGGASYRTPAQVLSDIVAAPKVHDHGIANITGLAAALAGKADLVGGKVNTSQVPAWLLGGQRFTAAISAGTHTLDATYLSAQGIAPLDTTAVGKYFIFTGASGCVLTLGANIILTTGDENVTSGPITLEHGDWIVYRGYSSPNYQFDVLNNNYQHASTTAAGIGQLSTGSATTRGGLATTSNSLKVVDENALRNVLKGIYYESSEAGVATPLTGDLLFQYTE